MKEENGNRKYNRNRSENKDMNNRPNERPFFSIVMPVYNGQKYIKTMIESIRRRERDGLGITGGGRLLHRSKPKDCSGTGRKRRTDPFDRHGTQCRSQPCQKSGYPGSKRKLSVAGRDADDLVEENLLEKVQNSLRENPAKLVIFGLIEVL